MALARMPHSAQEIHDHSQIIGHTGVYNPGSYLQSVLCPQPSQPPFPLPVARFPLAHGPSQGKESNLEGAEIQRGPAHTIISPGDRTDDSLAPWGLAT